MYVEVKELAPVIRRALESVKYGSGDIKVTATESVGLSTGGGAKGARRVRHSRQSRQWRIPHRGRRLGRPGTWP